jgi:hypothetical protein
MTSIVLFIASLALSWLARPRTEWSGEEAALFCSGLIGLCASAWQLLTLMAPSTASSEVSYLLTSLCQYAALPLLLLVAALQGLKLSGYADAQLLNWDRVIWGRILLVVCVIYVLMQRSNNLPWLDIGILVLSCLAAVTWLIALLRRQCPSVNGLFAFGWLVLVASYIAEVLPGDWLIPLGFVCAYAITLPFNKVEG